MPWFLYGLRTLRRARGFLASCAAAAALLFSIGAAPAETLLAVATFEYTRPQAAGTTVVRVVRLSNLSEPPLELSIQPRVVELQDDGRTHVGDGEDPR